MRIGRVDRAGQLVEQSVVVAEQVGGANEERHDIAFGDGIEQREEFVANPVATEPRIGVGRVAHRIELQRGAEPARVVAAQREQGVAAARPHRGQPGGSAAAEQGEEHRLGLVVGGVPRQCVRSEQFVAGDACPGFEVRPIDELGPVGAECHAEAIGDPLSRGGFVVRILTDTVVDVDCDDIEVCGDGERDQCTRVWTPGEATGDGRAGGWEGAAGEEFAGEPSCVGSQRSWWRRCRLPLGCRLASTLYR